MISRMLMMAANAGGSSPVAGSLVYFGTFPDPYTAVNFGIGIAPDSHNVYATNSAGALRVWSKENNGNLTIQSQSAGDFGSKIIIPNNQFIYIFDSAHTLIRQLERETSGSYWGDIIAQNYYSDGNSLEQPTGPIAVVSKDIKNLYYGGIGTTYGIITNWKIDATYGTLTSYSITNLTGSSTQFSIAGSFDSKNIYLLADDDSFYRRLEVYDRENTNGVLTLNDTIALNSTTDVQLIINPNDLWVYVLHYDVGSGSDIKIYSRNATNGILTYDSSFSSGLDLRYAVISNDGTNIYIEGVAVVISTSVRRIYEFSLVNNSITYLGFVTIPDNDYSICIDPIIISSDDVFVYYGGTVSIYGYQRTPPPVGSVSNVYAANGSSDTLSVFSRNTSSGALSGTNTIGTGSHPDIVVVSPDGKNVYTTNEYGHTISVFDRNLTSGDLSYNSTINASEYSSSGPLGIAISADGKNVYVGCFNINRISIFDRNLTTGVLTFNSSISFAGTGPWGIVVSLDGLNVYVVANTQNELFMFSRDISTGLLSYIFAITPTGGLAVESYPTSICISLDGLFVYVSNSNSHSISAFSRSGGVLFDSVGGPYSTGNIPYGICISADGKNVYTSNISSQTVSVFDRSTSFGTLTLTDSVSALNGIIQIAISADGKNVYVSNSGASNNVSIFDRDLTTGALSGTTTIATGTAPFGIAVYPTALAPPTPTPTPTPTPVNPYCVSSAGSTGVNGTYTFVSIPSSFYSSGYWEKIGDTAYTFGYDYNEEWWVIKNESTYLYGASYSMGPTVPPMMWSYTYGMGTAPPPYTASGTC